MAASCWSGTVLSSKSVETQEVYLYGLTMLSLRSSATNIFIHHWFWLLFVAAVLVLFLVSPVLLLENAKIAEMVILFDLCIFLPAVYVICYRNQQSVRQILLRIIGVISLGIFIGAWLIPESVQAILPNLFIGRNIAITFVIIVELFALIAILKMAFAKDNDPVEIAKQSGAPEAFVKFMVLEANFWKAVWNFFNPRK